MSGPQVIDQPRATITIPKGAVRISDPETCPGCSELVQLNRPLLRARISDEEWTALTKEALVVITQRSGRRASNVRLRHGSRRC